MEFLKRVSILVILLLLILAPRPLAGYLDLERARRLSAAGKPVEAAAAFQVAAERLPWQPAIWEEAGVNASQGGDPAAAIRDLNAASAGDKLSKQGWETLGEAYQKTGDTQSATIAWQKALPLPEAYNNLAYVKRKAGDLATAEGYLQDSLRQDPKDAEALFQLGLLEMATDPPQALTDLMQSAHLNPKLDASIEDLRSALNTAFLSNDRAYQFLLSGRALGAGGNWDLAAAAFRNALSVRAQYAEAWAWLGEALEQQGLAGTEEIDRARALDPNSAMIQSLYGLSLERQKKPELALAAFQKAVELEPQDPGWQMALGGAYEQTGDLVAALVHYQNATSLAPQEAATWRALAEFSLRNSVDIAGVGLPAARKLVEFNGNDWQSLDIAGQILVENNDVVGAEAILVKAVKLAPTQAAPALHLGFLYLQKGNLSAAYSYLTVSKTFDPTGPYGWQAKRLLEEYFP